LLQKAKTNLAAPGVKCLRSRGRSCLPGENRPAQSRANSGDGNLTDFFIYE
jgi:hypothetical protein